MTQGTIDSWVSFMPACCETEQDCREALKEQFILKAYQTHFIFLPETQKQMLNRITKVLFYIHKVGDDFQ